MGILNAFKKEEKSLSSFSKITESIATLEEIHKNAANELMSPKERAKAVAVRDKLKDARKMLHSAEASASKKDIEKTYEHISSAKKSIEEYISAAGSFTPLVKFKEEAETLQVKLAELEHNAELGKL
ncbi:MAG: hypothetical protein AB1668_00925 [Nanoarchaeota archaeon]